MSQEETATKADDMYSSKKEYVLWAKKVLPILVRQAKAHNSIYYSDLAKEIGISSPRNLNYPLGSIGNTLKIVGTKLGLEVPQIQAIVINKTTDLPGDGFFPFANILNHKDLTSKDKKELTDRALLDIYHFKKWNEVLAELDLVEVKIPRLPVSIFAGEGGEGEEHKAFKKYVSENPQLFGGSKKDRVTIEYLFPSSDSIDVEFESDSKFIGVEVKSSISNEEDILRGIFQCIKYKALAEAVQTVENKSKEIQIYLALESEFPANLLQHKNSLRIEVMDDMKAKRQAQEIEW